MKPFARIVVLTAIAAFNFSFILPANAQTDSSTQLGATYKSYQWLYNPTTGHFYTVIDSPGFTWSEARKYAKSLGGYLVSINSQAENEWLYTTYSAAHPGETRIGLYSENGSWKWDSGESVTYSVLDWGWGGSSAVVYYERGKSWLQRPSEDLLGIIVELDGTLAGITPTPIAQPEGYIWKFNPQNGHHYVFMAESVGWNDAKTAAKSMGGYLVAINDADENQWIMDNFLTIAGERDIWIGCADEDNDGMWNWINGESMMYTNWAPGEPKYREFDQYAIILNNTIKNRNPKNYGMWHFKIANSNPAIIEINPYATVSTPTPTATPTTTPTSTPTPGSSSQFLWNGYDWRYNPATGHYYALLLDWFTWDEAAQFAQEMGGYIVAINNAAEDDWLTDWLSSLGYSELWIGAHRENGEWKWLSGEPLSYINWNPNGWSGDTAVLCPPKGKGWFERPITDKLGFIVEVEGRNPNPDLSPKVSEWRYNPQNKHSYAVVSERVPWWIARDQAVQLGGYMVTLTSEEENAFVKNLALDYGYTDYWIGFRKNNIGLWEWVTGELFSYSSWILDEFTGMLNVDVFGMCSKRGWTNRANPFGIQCYIVEKGAYEPVYTPTPTPSLKPNASINLTDWYYNPENGHYYALIAKRTSWSNADSTARGLGGYLVTITSPSENAFINRIADYYGYSELWIGLYRSGETWKWLTGEAFSYASWAPGEPSGDGEYVQNRSNGWNDSSDAYHPECYVVEKSENVQPPTPTPAVPTEPQWHFNPQNGHTYALYPGLTTFDIAAQKAKELGAYLVSITSQEEDDWLQATFSPYCFHKIFIGAIYDGSKWVWLSGEPFEYTNWTIDQPVAGAPYTHKYFNESKYQNRWASNYVWYEYKSPVIFERDERITPTPTAPSASPTPGFTSNLTDWYYNPENGHYYALMIERASWNEAKNSAIQLGGYLATLTSASENDFVRNIVKFFGFEEIWIGLYKTNDWEWITGEPFSYSPWAPGEPSGDGSYGQSRLVGWNDAPNSYYAECYAIEKSENVPLPSPTPSSPPGLVWHYNSQNGHSYALISDMKTLDEAKQKAKELGGYMVSITSSEEEEWIQNTFSPYHYRFIYIGLINTGTSLYWLSGEPFSYSNFMPDQPESVKPYIFKFINDESYENKWGSGRAWNTSGYNMPVLIEIERNVAFTNFSLNLDENSLEENQLSVDTPVGYNQGGVQLDSIPPGAGTNGKGLILQLKPGEGAWVLCSKEIEAPSLMEIQGIFRASSRRVSLGLVALNCPIDGQLGYIKADQTAVPVDEYSPLRVIYQPPSGRMKLAVMAVNPHFSEFTATVWIDNLTVSEFDLANTQNWKKVPLEVDGSFDLGIEKLLTNINLDDGIVLPFFQSISDVALRLMLDPSQTAANIGTTCSIDNEDFPVQLLSQVRVQRDSLPGGGMIGFLLTNGFQNLGLFRLADSIAESTAGEEIIRIGGNFQQNNLEIPLSAFVQLGGPGVDASVAVDDLLLLQEK